MAKKTKIVVDSDVLIHFAKGGILSLLPSIFPEYQYIILSNVYDEVKSLHTQLDNQMRFLKNISLETFMPTGEMLIEYAKLSDTFGDGESACMAYCRFTQNVLGSSNLHDISDYCKENRITYLTTIDFLYYAYIRRKMTKEDCDAFIKEVIEKGSKLPLIDISTYVCKVDI